MFKNKISFELTLNFKIFPNIYNEYTGLIKTMLTNVERYSLQ